MKKFKNIFSFLMAMGLGNAAFAQEVVSTSDPSMHYYLLSALAVILIILILVLNGAISGLASNKSILEQLKGKKGASIVLALLFAGIGKSAFAQEAVASNLVVVEPNYGVVFWMFVLVDLVLLMIVIVQLSVLNGLTRAIKGEAVAADETIVAPEPVGLQKFWEKLTDAVPLEREEEVMTDHEYDGIKELDNKLPPWWVWLFNLSIIFAVVYFAYYQVFNSSDLPVSIQEYNAEMAQADEEIAAYKEKFGSGVDETTAELITDPARLAEGEKIYQANCVSCHMVDGGGGIGPNFTDQYWIHGGDIKDLFTTIKYGVITKGMIPWKDQLKPDEIENVASYILTTFPGTTPENPKAPQGELYTP
jgi:cytochrome c oxidase cbb3-type subunit 3